MNKLLKYVSLLLIFTLAIGINTADAQKRKTKRQLREEAEAAAKKAEENKTKNMDDDDSDATEDYFDDKGGFKHRLWYGGGLNLAFTGNNMLLGISPMVGYKITDRFSVGPRVAIDYQEFFVSNATNPRLLLWGIGGFGRAKITDALFAHVEYSYRKISSLNDVTPEFTTQNDNFYIGGGYHSSGGGPFGYEIVVLYNTSLRDTNNVPIDYRIGFTWNF